MGVSEILNKASLYLAGKRYGPLDTLIIEATNHCNRKCFFCGAAQASPSPKRGFMDWQLFTMLAEEAQRLRPKLVSLHAHGEPLLHPKIVDMVALLSVKGLQTQIVTNGDPLTPLLSSQLCAAGLSMLTISHPGITAENWNACRGDSSLNEVENRLRDGLTVWSGMSSSVTLRCLVFPDHVAKKLSAIAGYLQKWFECPGIGALEFWLYQPWPEHVLAEELIYISEKQQQCYSAMHTLSVSWDGHISPCPFDYQGELAMGKYPEHNLYPLDSISRLTEFRKNSARRNKNRPNLCKKCLINRAPGISSWVHLDEYRAVPAENREKWLKNTGRRCWQQLLGVKSKELL